MAVKSHLVACVAALSIIMSFWGRLSAQDPVYSQFYASPLLLNPAFVGTTNSPRIALNYRNQWASIFNAYTTYAVSFDRHFEDINSGIGFAGQVDQAGDGIYNVGQFHLTYAYRIPVGHDAYVKGGIQAGLYQVTLDWDKLIFLDQIDPLDGSLDLSEENRPEQLSRGLFDVSAGLLFYSKMFYGGISLFHINTPDDNLLDSNTGLTDGLPVRFSVHGGMQISLTRNNNTKNKAFISPNLLYTQQQNFRQATLGTFASYGPVNMGIWYRHAFGNPDAAIFSVGGGMGVLKVGYSYDWTISNLKAVSRGTHEISLLFNFDHNQRRGPDYNDCLQLFR